MTEATDDPVDLLALAWTEAGLRAPVTVAAPRLCDFPECPSNAIVYLKTADGPIHTCLRHFNAVKARVTIR